MFHGIYNNGFVYDSNINKQVHLERPVIYHIYEHLIWHTKYWNMKEHTFIAWHM